MIDTAQITKRLINRTTDRLTTGEGNVVRYGDVRRVRKVHVDCSASRPLRGQSPAHNSSRYVRRTETVRNRLIRKPTTKPLPQPVAKAQTQEPQRKKPRNTTARASKRVYNPNPSFPRTRESEKSKPCRIERHRRSPALPQNAHQQRERAGVRARGGAGPDGLPQRNPPNNQNPSFKSFHIMAIMVLPHPNPSLKSFPIPSHPSSHC